MGQIAQFDYTRLVGEWTVVSVANLVKFDLHMLLDDRTDTQRCSIGDHCEGRVGSQTRATSRQQPQPSRLPLIRTASTRFGLPTDVMVRSLTIGETDPIRTFTFNITLSPCPRDRVW